MRFFVLLVLLTALAQAETKTLTLRQALDLALTQNPDIVLGRLDQQKSRAQVDLANDVFHPKLNAGTGYAYTSGYPTSIDGNPPAVFQSKLSMALFNRPQSYLVAQARESVRAAGMETARRQNEVVYRVAALYFDAARAARNLETVKREADNLARVRELTDQRVAEGRELPLEAKKANLAVLRAQQRVETFSIDLVNAEDSLVQLLGLQPGDKVAVAAQELQPLTIPDSEDSSIETALAGSQDVKRLESDMQGRLQEIKSYQSARLPKLDFFVQYALLLKQNYQDYFTRFQANNVEVGVSIQIPLIVGRGISAQQDEAAVEVAKLKVELARTRLQIAGDVRRAYQDLRRAESARQLARADLDVTREELNVFLAQLDEGRLPLAKVEAARATENEKWLAYYDAEHAAEVAKLGVLRQLGTLEAALR